MPQNVKGIIGKKKSVGELREEDRYHGDWRTDRKAFHRRSLDRSFTPRSKYMEETVRDTSTTLLNAAAQRGLDEARVDKVKKIRSSRSKY